MDIVGLRSVACRAAMALVLAWPLAAAAADKPIVPAEVGASTWDLGRAQALRQRSAVSMLAEAKRGGAPARAGLAERALQDLTGYGSTHAPREAVLAQARQDQFAAMEARLAAAAREGKLREVVEALQGDAGAKGATTTMRLRAPVSGYPSGGYAYVYQGGNYQALAYIQPDGSIAVPLAPGEVVDLAVFPGGNFAIQVVEGVTLAAAGEVAIEDSVRVPFAVAAEGGASYSGGFAIQFRISLRTTGLIYERDADESVPGEAAFWLAPSQAYQVQSITADFPWLVEAWPAGVSGSDADIPVSLARGFELVLWVYDPANLQQGCFPYVQAYGGARVPDFAYGSAGRQVSRWTAYRESNQSDRLVRMELALPRGEPVSVAVRFRGLAGDCLLQDFELPVSRFREDVRMDLVLSPRPLPQVSVRTPQGDDLPWSYGYFVETVPPFVQHYFSPGNAASGFVLQAGREYDVHVVTQSPATGAWTRITAQGGAFPVDIVAEPTADVLVRLDPGPQSSIQGVLKAWQGAELRAAIELVGGRDYRLRIPPGDWDFELAGLSGYRYEPASQQTVALALRPVWRSETIVAGQQRLDFALAQPQAGIRLDLSAAELPVHATVLEAGIAVAAVTMQPWWRGLVTDITSPTLRLRGPGLDDSVHAVSPSPSRPLLSLPALGGGGRLQGTLRDGSGGALPNQPIIVSGEDAAWVAGATTDGGGRFDLPKIRNALYLFSAPPAGTSLMAQVDVGSPSGHSRADVVLPSAAIATGPAGGAALKRIYGSGQAPFRIVFLAEGYVAQQETFTDLNGNGVWDGVLYLDFNGDGLWQNSEPISVYGDRSYPWDEAGTDVSSDNEPFNDLNGDAYPNIDDRAVFEDNARSYLRALLGVPEIRAQLDVDAYIAFASSAQAGVDVFDAGGALQESRDTRFGASYERNRSLLTVDFGAVESYLSTQLGDWDLPVVLINQPVRVGRANSYTLANGGVGHSTPNNLVAGHEFGHNPGRLLDEYDEFGDTITTYVSPSARHVTHDPDHFASPWAALLDNRSDTPVAVPGSHGVGMYAGALYNAGGVYRPTTDSRMRYNAPQFNAPSARALSRSLCIESLRPGDAALSLPPPPPARVHGNGFEAPMEAYQPPCGE